MSANFRNEQASFWPTFRYISSFNWTHSTEIKSGLNYNLENVNEKFKLLSSSKKDWALKSEQAQGLTVIQALHHPPPPPSSRLHAPWRHSSVPRGDARCERALQTHDFASSDSRPRCRVMALLILVLGDESTAWKSWSPTKKS